MVEIEKKLKEMNLELPEVPMDMWNWARCKRAGNFIFMGTTGPWPLINRGEREKMIGAIGREITVEEGKEICKMCALSMLAALKNELGDLDKIDKIVRLEVYINGIGGEAKPYIEVADAASKLFIDLFGEDGRATRTVTGQDGINNVAVELDMVVYVKD
jgi:hypothetical protein